MQNAALVNHNNGSLIVNFNTNNFHVPNFLTTENQLSAFLSQPQNYIHRTRSRENLRVRAKPLRLIDDSYRDSQERRGTSSLDQGDMPNAGVRLVKNDAQATHSKFSIVDDDRE